MRLFHLSLLAVALFLFYLGWQHTENDLLPLSSIVPSSVKIEHSFSPTILPSETQKITTSPSASSSTSPSPNGVLVTHVVDGDTIELETGETVRYIGVDTPETVHPHKPIQCFGHEASAKNTELVLGKRVRLEKDVSNTDKYGRLLRYVYVGNVFINEELVRQGYAYARTFLPDVAQSAQFRRDEADARTHARGLWSACALEEKQTPSPLPGCTIKGNISSDEKRVYHLPGCKSYAATTISLKKGERFFCTEDEARAAGWRKATNC